VPIKNYTTEISAMKSIGEIQGCLVAHGARSIMINYDENREPVSLSFLISIKGKDMPFQLPANIKKVEAILGKHKRLVNQEKLHAQASRVVWRILKDWVTSQMAILETEMVTLDQIFLSYMEIKEGKTLYQVLESRGFYLTEGKSQ
jgi:hypothetical protein